MKRRSYLPHGLARIWISAAAATSLVCNPLAAAAPGATSPAQVVESVNLAISQGDFTTLVGLVDPIDLPRVIAVSLATNQGLAVRFEKTNEFEALLDKYGLRPLLDPAGPYAAGVDETRQFFEGTDTSAILVELYEFTLGAGGQEWLHLLILPAGECANLQVGNDRADCTIEFEEVRFVQREGFWYLDLDYPEE